MGFTAKENPSLDNAAHRIIQLPYRPADRHRPKGNDVKGKPEKWNEFIDWQLSAALGLRGLIMG